LLTFRISLNCLVGITKLTIKKAPSGAFFISKL
jgi:hypothetical protein